MASFSREFAVIDTRLEYLELTRAGAMEVFAVDPAELASVHGVPVPEHGAFVGRVLPPESLEGRACGAATRGRPPSCRLPASRPARCARTKHR